MEVRSIILLFVGFIIWITVGTLMGCDAWSKNNVSKSTPVKTGVAIIGYGPIFIFIIIPILIIIDWINE